MVLFGGIMRRREERRVEEAENRGWSQGFAKGFAEGFTQGFAEGIAQERAKWQDWNRRRLEAAAEGRPFNEPPPPKPPSENKPEVS